MPDTAADMPEGNIAVRRGARKKTKDTPKLITETSTEIIKRQSVIGAFFNKILMRDRSSSRKPTSKKHKKGSAEVKLKRYIKFGPNFK